MEIGDRIKQRRKELGLSAEEVAEKLGISPATIYRYESNDIVNMRVDKLEPIAKVLKTTPAFLMGWEGKNTQADISDEDVMFALFDGNEDITPEMYEDVKRYARFIMEQKKAKEHKDSK